MLVRVNLFRSCLSDMLRIRVPRPNTASQAVYLTAAEDAVSILDLIPALHSPESKAKKDSVESEIFLLPHIALFISYLISMLYAFSRPIFYVDVCF
jgi:hypothetical protein